jgi:hypothetical protein
MSDSASNSWLLNPKDDSTNPNGKEEVRWEVVAQVSGLAPATIIAGRLQVEGIPARVWQESAGQAIGLTVGLLGTGYVAVPEDYVTQALDILEHPDGDGEWDREEGEWGEEDYSEEST